MELSTEILGLEHRDEIWKALKNMNPQPSEYCFSNLYFFRKQHDYRILRKNGYLFVQGHTYDGINYVMPLVDLASAEIGEVLPILREFLEQGFSIYPVTEKELAIFGDDVEYSFNKDDSDYIYTAERIKTYPGRHLHKKRNLVKQYRSLYKFKDKKYDCVDQKDAKFILDQWFENTGLAVEETDYVQCLEAIELCAAIRLKGQLYYANDKPVGLLFGERLNDSSLVIHFAKGNIAYKGIYAHMYNSLANNLEDEYKFYNFEQDLGKESLRQAKSTYMQDALLDKYRVSLK